MSTGATLSWAAALFQHRRQPLIIVDDTIKCLELISLCHRNRDALDLEYPFVGQESACCLRLAVVCGKRMVFVHRWRQLVDRVTLRQGDLEQISVLTWTRELDVIAAWLSRFQQPGRHTPQYARSYRQKVSSGRGVQNNHE